MQVEEAFDIVIEDGEAEKSVTPGHLIELILSKVGRTTDATCLTQRAFHRARASLMRQLHIKRDEIRPDTPLTGLFPRPTRRQQVRQVLADLGLSKEIELTRPEWLQKAILAVDICGALGLTAYLLMRPFSSNFALLNFAFGSPLLAGILFVILFSWAALYVSRSKQNEFQPSMANVGHLARWIVANAPDLVKAPPGPWSREQVSEVVRQIVVEALCCEEIYRENANFVKDLGLS